MATLLNRIVFTLLAGACLLSISWGGISKNADQVTYDYFYYQEPLLDMVNDVRRLSKKNILFRPADLKGVNISYGREQVELMTSFSEVLDIYGFGFKRMADNIFMIERIRSVEEVEAALLRSDNSGEEETSSSAESEVAVSNTLVTNTAVENSSPAFKVSKSSGSLPVSQREGQKVAENNNQNPSVTRLENPDFIRAVAGFQRRYIEALVAEGFTKEEAMKMAMGFNPAALVPSEETPPTP